MEGGSLLIPLNFRVKGNYSFTNDMECRVVTKILMGSYQGINIKSISIYIFTIYFLILKMYAIALVIDTEILIPLVIRRNDCAFNHAYI